MDIKRSGSQPSGKGPAEYFTGTVRIDPCSRHLILHARAVPVSRSSRALGLHGILIRWARPSSSRLAMVGSNAGVVRLRTFDRVT